jgi:hypothetical protein
VWFGLFLPPGTAAQQILPLRDIRAGMKGIGKTVFAGDRIETFEAEILGVLENTGPRQSVILARLSGGPLAETGVLQGMSGSPIYIDGKLAGAVALAYTFAKHPIAGVRPIEEMLGAGPPAVRRASRPESPFQVNVLAGLTDSRTAHDTRAGRLVELTAPLSFSGFSPGTLARFAPELEAAGLVLAQAPGGASPPGTRRLGDPRSVSPGSMISVQLMTGDLAVGADGTVTHIDGERLYAFGHRFIGAGGTELPFARAEVVSLLPNLSSSFKISAAREPVGVITQDRFAGISGVFGREARTVPLAVRVAVPGRPAREYRMRMAEERALAPLLVQMAVYSALDATERLLGAATVRLRGTVEFANAEPVRIENLYAADANLPLLASLGAVTPLAYAVQSGFEQLRPKSVRFDAEVIEEKRQWQIDRLWTSTRRARPGDEIEIAVALAGESGAEKIERRKYRVPVGAPAGPLTITASEGLVANLIEYQATLATPPASAAQVVALLNGLRPNSGVYLRVARADASYPAGGRDLPAPPASLALLFSRAQAAAGTFAGWRGSTLAEIPIDLGLAAVSGSRSLTLEIRE